MKTRRGRTSVPWLVTMEEGRDSPIYSDSSDDGTVEVDDTPPVIPVRPNLQAASAGHPTSMQVGWVILFKVGLISHLFCVTFVKF